MKLYSYDVKLYRNMTYTVAKVLLCIMMLPTLRYSLLMRELAHTDWPFKRVCEPISEKLYSLIRPKVKVDFHHGYHKVLHCGQVFYQDLQQSRYTTLSHSAEEYARIMKRIKGTGYLDFQLPDEAFVSSDHGYVTFPVKKRCSQGPDTNKSSSIFLSTMLTANSFRALIFDNFVDYYASLGIEYENMLFTIQVNKYTKEDKLRLLVRKLESRNIYYDFFWGNWTSESLMFHQSHKLLYCTTK